MALSPKKKPDAAFIIRLVGVGIRPWAVPMRSLAKVLDAVQRLVEQRDDLVDDFQAAEDSQSDSGTVLHLLTVKSSSAAYEVAAPADNPLKVIRGLSEAISRPKDADWLDSTLSSVREISEVAKSLGCEIEFRRPAPSKPYGGVVAKITPTTYSDIEGSAFIEARTSVYARIESAGGATGMRCGIRLPAARRMVHCRVKSEELVRELGRYMYAHVILTGTTTWLRHNWRLKRIVIDSVEPPKQGSVKDALRNAHRAGGSAWDAVDDPEKLMAEIRGA